MNILRRSVGMGERLHWGYRCCWSRCATRDWIAYPFGIHWVARAIHQCWEWTFNYRPGPLETRLDAAYAKGRDDGYRIGRSDMIPEALTREMVKAFLDTPVSEAQRKP